MHGTVQRQGERLPTSQVESVPAPRVQEQRRPQFAQTTPGQLRHGAPQAGGNPPQPVDARREELASRIQQIMRSRARDIEYMLRITPLVSRMIPLVSIENRRASEQEELDGLVNVISASFDDFDAEDFLRDVGRPRQLEADMMLVSFHQLTNIDTLHDDPNRLQDIDDLIAQLSRIRVDPVQPNVVQTMLEQLRSARDQLS